MNEIVENTEPEQIMIKKPRVYNYERQKITSKIWRDNNPGIYKKYEKRDRKYFNDYRAKNIVRIKFNLEALRLRKMYQINED